MDTYPLIGNSDKYVLNFIIKPQFNKLNFNDIISDAIFKDFMLKNGNPEHKNSERYDNKRIITCIFTLDSIVPIVHEFNIDKKNKILIQFTKEYLFHKYSKDHEIIFALYDYCKKNKPEGKDSISYMIDELSKENERKRPVYIKDYFKDIQKEITKLKNNNKSFEYILKKVNDKESFFENLNQYLNDAIDNYLEIKDKQTITDY
jgi:hypothetical protein